MYMCYYVVENTVGHVNQTLFPSETTNFTQTTFRRRLTMRGESVLRGGKKKIKTRTRYVAQRFHRTHFPYAVIRPTRYAHGYFRLIPGSSYSSTYSMTQHLFWIISCIVPVLVVCLSDYDSAIQSVVVLNCIPTANWTFVRNGSLILLLHTIWS